MVSTTLTFAAIAIVLTSRVAAHIGMWDPSMYGFNQSSFDQNRPQDPLSNLTFDEWWFHGHGDYPPNPGDIMSLPAGGNALFELSCDKGTTTWWESAPGGNTFNASDPDNPCPGQPTTQYHTNGIHDLGGCALAVQYTPTFKEVQPEKQVIFSINHTCVWKHNTYFAIPQEMPACPEGGCHCSWHWNHRSDSGSEQIYMVGFRCTFTNTTSTRPLGTPHVARRCGAEPEKNLPARPENCTRGPKLPLYWLQKERNNMFEDYIDPPLYNALYGFADGAQTDIFENVTDSESTSAPSSTVPPPPSSTSTRRNRPSPKLLYHHHHHHHHHRRHRHHHHSPSSVRPPGTEQPTRTASPRNVHVGKGHASRAWGQHRSMIGKHHP